MHAARIGSSPRLRRVLAALAGGAELSTREIVARADVCAVNSCIAELRANGVAISCRQEARGGQRRFFYKMTGAAATATDSTKDKGAGQ